MGVADTVELALEAQKEMEGNTEEVALAQMNSGPKRKTSL